MMDVTTPLGMLVENMEYMPEVLPAMMTFMTSEKGVSFVVLWVGTGLGSITARSDIFQMHFFAVISYYIYIIRYYILYALV